MSKFIDDLRSTFSSAPRLFTVLALVAVITVPNMMSALSTTSDQSFYTLSAPCGVFDTRNADFDGDGELARVDPDEGKPQPDDSFEFYVADDADGDQSDRLHFFNDQPETTETVEEHQGAINSGTENPNGCRVPEDAQTVFININAVSPEGGGNLQAYTPGTPDAEQGGVLLFDANDSVGIANGLILEIDTSSENTQGHLVVEVTGAATHVRGVVMGYTCADDTPCSGFAPAS